MFDTSRLGGWSDLPFWSEDLPRIETALAGQRVLPPPDRAFAALERSQPEATRVVILGQDPYHTPGKADGLAFSIPREFGGRLDSLGNIFKELEADLGVARTNSDLSDWADQGVLLLNTALSVPPGQPKAHARIGWTALVTQVLARLDDAPRAFLFWGGPAQAFARHLRREDHLVISSAHPSPLSAHRGFFGSRPFSRVNDWLAATGRAPIVWG
ncbi:uracil-DNA glycosylase [Ponticoccus sp. SC2-23]|uniref:uracil-DNA glycosylase n=1 Tax=Alexandriicola marinus TaxID=2081710 RepID=UPI000FDC8BA8|nr:uracil-DNA glycosylase [Alexandriicola marinus]MBM1219237.1 uracil-DNA glycosylase [Ponticoccus sp. SC6-9]MBM1223691.1 uracil-DNA glycosylase [Ponticoccus sp. SC6-15]MBM1229050.1 uracil-DNA glycosylase [Ponticoccus sp. SC6-38]MBM1232657.1 uracil-DNA glycosylase [Ponticoccus sp. SC6-45]MBM1237393.1 uracil-DNA glycosylase [Ponticoccus sp. SC6-49]MBM1241668.1 uracil-DNA glycosylase [Ponticoccus sp. SC2-64]MBM1246181.1 uracil-DNA glycosylase [Ponticoccus sp. SC6-42]MBM1250659.1 uracil-DNA gl